MCVCVRMCVYVCVQLYMGGVNDQCVTGIHLLGSCDFPNGDEILKEVICRHTHTYTHTQMHTHTSPYIYPLSHLPMDTIQQFGSLTSLTITGETFLSL